MTAGRLLRLCLAIWIFAFLAGASYAIGPGQDGAKMAQTTTR